MSLRTRLSLIILVLAVVSIGGGILIIKNLSAFRKNQTMITFKDSVYHDHHSALSHIQSAQSLLYQYKAGYGRDIDSLVEHIIEFENIIGNIPQVYRANLSPDYCNSCHGDATAEIGELEEKIDGIREQLLHYRENISILITTNDENSQILHHGQASALGKGIESSIRIINNSAKLMVEELRKSNLDLVQETTLSIVGVLSAITFIALALLIYVLYALHHMMVSLLKGTESIYRDDFTERLAAAGRQDEFGLLASRFNLMAEHLQERDREISDKASQLEAANKELKDLNENLGARIAERTSELEHMVEKLRRTTEALEESKARLEAANVDLLKANQAKSNFLSIVSHELKTPLSVINGFLSLILDERYQNDPRHLKEAVEISKRRGQQLARMIDELIDLSRLDARAMVIHKELVSARTVLKDIEDQFAEEAQRKQIRIRVDGCSGLPTVNCDPDKFRQILTNLISNALKFSPEGSEIVITCREEKDFFLFSCSDKGIGISAKEKEKVFEKFYQVDSSATRRYGGAGLGLSIVKEIVHLHGGRIWVESEPGRGCTFSFTIPKDDVSRGSGNADGASLPRESLEA